MLKGQNKHLLTVSHDELTGVHPRKPVGGFCTRPLFGEAEDGHLCLP